MKIRTGFVSNSSSSSFIIFGSELGSDIVDIIMERHPNSLDDGISLLVQKMLEDAGIFNCFVFGSENGDLYIGRSWEDVQDDETGKQFKESVRESISRFAALINPQEPPKLIISTICSE